MFTAIELKNALQFATKAMAKNDNRPVLTGVYFDFSTLGKCSIVAADGYRMHYATLDYNGPLMPSIILDGTQVKTLANGIKKTGSTRIIIQYTQPVVFEQYYKNKDYKWECAEVQGKYPHWDMIIPNATRQETAIYIDHKTATMIYNVFESFGTVTLANNKAYTRDDKDFHTTMNIPCELPENLVIGINPVYLIDAMHTEDSIMLRVDSNVSPMVVHTKNNRHAVIMPMSTIND